MSENEKDLTRIKLNGKEIIILGTAHVSKRSAEQVKEIVEEEKPDSICIELCKSRYESLKDPDRWKKTDIIKVIKEKRAMFLLANLILSSFQKRIAKKMDINSGQEMIQGMQCAEETGAELVLADRDISTTFSRIWGKMGFFGKIKLFFQFIFAAVSNEEVTEEELEELKSGDMLDAALGEMSKSFPSVKSVLIDERDQYLSEKIKTAPGKKIFAIVGAGHLPGIKKEIERDHDLAELEKKPPKKHTGKIIGFTLAALIVLMVILTFSVDSSAGISQILSWVIWNGSLSALGTLIALGHPLSILTAFAVAPISSLSPLLAAGWFAGLVEATIRKPKVADFQNLSTDLYTVKGFWKNRVTRILLVIILANLGSVLGTVIGGLDIIKTFFETVF